MNGRLNENINRSFIDCLVLEKEKEKNSPSRWTVRIAQLIKKIMRPM